VTYPAVYLDAASAEPLHPAAREVLVAAHERGYADPRRLHGPGRDARLLLDNAREVVAECLGVRRDEVMFTSSGTAAVDAGINGLRLGRSGRDEESLLVTTAVEHQAVVDAAARHGLQTVTVPVDRHGRVDSEELVGAVHARRATLAAVQHANHEVGTVQPISQVAAQLGSVPLFVDACATMGRLPLPAGWAAVAGSARKWGGPGGVGVLALRRTAPWRSPLPTGADDRADHDFTNIPGALAAAAALQALIAEREAINARQRDLIDLVRARVGQIPDVDVVGDPSDRLPHLVTFSFLYVDGEALVTELDKRGFGIASGSACAQGGGWEPSRVLGAMGALTHGNVRLSLTRDTTREDVERFLEVLPEVVGQLRAVTGL
jgi:cysteine desulfurase